MAKMTSKGNCYLCGKQFSKAGFTKHILSAHPYVGPGEDCLVLKVEDLDTKMFWLYLEIRETSTLKVLDTFLRKIWLECCGHLSCFSMPGYGDVGMGQKLENFPVGCTLRYEYDFGSTTELKITVVGRSRRPKQKQAVRVLGRNEKYHFECQGCGKEANLFYVDYSWENPYPFWCASCAEQNGLDDELFLPVVNSPRMGVCAYHGDQDEFEFDPASIV